MPTANKLILSFQSVGFTYRDGPHHLHTLSQISFDMQQGEIVAVVGPSGAGKSTLLRLAADLTSPSSGAVVRNYGRCGMVFQDFALFPWLSLEQNVAFGLTLRGVPKTQRRKIAHERLEEVGLMGFAHRYPHELSGGMRQRVGIARALAVEPDLLLMDEPFSALDSISADHLKKDLLAIWNKRRFAILIVVHTIADAVELADRIVIVTQRPAMIKEILRNPLPRPRSMRTPEAYHLMDAITSHIDAGMWA